MQPIAWANQLVTIWRVHCNSAGVPVYPIRVKDIIDGYVNERFPDERVAVSSQEFDSIEGVLTKLDKGGWGIFYNDKIKNVGRKNFTIAHELGHFLNHRTLQTEFRCGADQLHDLGGGEHSVDVEREANEFAAYLLMPMDQLRSQMEGKKAVSIADLQSSADLFETSLSATTFQWLKCTGLKAIYYEAHPEGFITSWRRTSEAEKAYVYLKFGLELPQESLARKCISGVDDYSDATLLPKGVWHAEHPVYESCFYNRWYQKIQGVLVYP